MAVVSGGTEDLSGDVDAQLVSRVIVTEFATVNSGLSAMDIDPRAPGSYAGDAAWVDQLPDDSITGSLIGAEQYRDAPKDVGHSVNRYYDQYWLAYNEALERGIEIPNPPTT